MSEQLAPDGARESRLVEAARHRCGCGSSNGLLFRDAELGRQCHSFGFRHFCGDPLQQVQALIGKREHLPSQRCVDVDLTRNLSHIESDLSELVDFVWRKTG
ncbi:MAG: hypothetical protein M3R40_07475 [Pseudomonadota bacterium]|nr:hypothetical protein [Pseudomonadota bacterium]